MPINPSALGDAAPEPEPDQPQAAPEEGKRKRRTKAELIADAVVPADDAQVELKDSSTGAKIQRRWLVALEMVRDQKAEWADKSMKYAMLKYDQQKASEEFIAGETSQPEPPEGPASQEPMGAADTVEPSDPTPSLSVPPDAEVGDEVRVGKDVFRVGNGGVLTSGPVSVDGEVVQPKRAWQRELGTGGKGPWEQVALLGSAKPEKADTNGKGKDVEPVTIPAGVTIEQISDGAWKIGTGILEKIGLPDYSSLQIGPISASRVAIDDGRRVTVLIGDREASIPAAVVEVAREAMDIVEYIARYQRGELVSFLESTGALRQPVSA
jgi:hypothetical protein